MYNIMRWRERAPKHVVMVSKHCCIRVQKQARALRAKGWRVDSLSCSRPSDITAFDYAYAGVGPSKMAVALKDCGASIIHVHNEPDFLMAIADKGADGRPVVYDCHDLEYHRHGYVTGDERFAFKRADGIVNVGESYRDFAYSLHPWDCPEAIVHSLPFRSQIPAPPAERAWAICYEGGICVPGSETFGWRDMTVPCREFADAGITFDLYTSAAAKPYYPNVRDFLPYDELMQAVSGYEFAFVGIDPAHDKYLMAYPNKLMESAACGTIPVIVNAPAAAGYFGSGIVATSTREAIALMRECDTEAMRRDVYAHVRFMDDEVDNTIALYARLLGKAVAS